MNKVLLVALIVIVAFGGLVLTFSGDNQVGSFMQSTFGGVTPLSISRASLVQDNVLGQAWVVSVSTLPNAFSLTGRISAVDVADKTGKTPLSDFDVNINAQQSAKFLVQDSGQVLYDYSMSYSRYSCLWVDTSRFDNSAFLSNGFKDSFSTNCYNVNVYRFPHGKFGVVSSQATFPTLVSISVLAGGKQSSTVVLDTASTTSLPLSVDGKVLGRVDYAGDLVNSALVRPEIFQSIKPVNKDGVWFFADINKYNLYNGLDNSNPYNSILSCVQSVPSYAGFGSGSAQGLYESCVNTYHNAYVNLQSKSVSGLSEIKVDSKSQLFTEFSLDRLYSFPVLTFVLDTDWVGFKVNKAVPSVQSATSSVCTSGLGGSVSASVKNVGDAGAFDVQLTCSLPVSVETSVQSQNFDSGEVKFFDFNFDMNVAKTTSSSCIVTATDKATFVKSTKSVSVSCNPAVTCIANDKQCIDNKVQQCMSDGSAFIVLNSCTNGCGVVDGVPNCLSKCVEGDVLCVDDLKNVCTNGNLVPILPAQSCSPLNCSAKFGGLVKGQLGVVGSCSSIWCSIGLIKPDTTTTCVYNYTPIIFVGIFVLILTAILVFGLKKNNVKSSRAVKVVPRLFMRKSFWMVLLALAFIVLLIVYFKLFFWIGVGIIVILILDAVFLKGIIRKIFM